MKPSDRAIYAREIINNPAWEQAFEEMKQYYFDQFIEYTDKETRERIAMSVDMMTDFRTIMEAFVAEGRLMTVGDNDAAA